MASVGYATLQIIPSMQGFQARLDRELSTTMATAGRNAGRSAGDNMAEGLSPGLARMSSMARTAAVATGAALATGAVAAAGWGLSIAAANEQAEISFTTMLGSAEKAQSFLEDLKQFAAETPFDFPGIQEAASRLIAIGIETERVIPIMTTLGDVTAGMGTGAEGIQRAMVALQQMNAAGRIMAEDLNQLRDAGVPVYDLLAAATGKAKEEVADLASKGKLGREELDQLMDALESGKGLERFSGLMDAQSKSLSGMVSTMKDLAGQGLATAMEPLADLLRDSLPTVTAWGEDAMPKVADGLAAAVDAGQDFARWVLPLARELRDDLLPPLTDVAEIAQGVLPVALGAGKLAVEGLAAAVGLAADIIEPFTSFLADHTDMVVIATGAWVAYQAVVKGAAVWTAASAAIQGVTASVTYLTGAIEALAATRGVSNLSAGVGVLRSSLSASIPAAAGATAGLAAFAAGAMAASYALDQLHASGRRDAEGFIAGMGEADLSTLDGINGRVADLHDEWLRLVELKNDGGTNWFDDQKLDEQITSIKAEMEAAQAIQTQVSTGLANWRNETKLTNEQTAVLLAHLGMDLPAAFDASGKASLEVVQALDDLRGAADITGQTIDEALTIDPELLKAQEKAVQDAMSAVAGAYAQFSDILQLRDESLDPKRLADAREAVADAERRVREAREGTDKGRVDAAIRDLEDARENVSELLATDSPLNKDKIAEFYRDVIAETEDFSGDIQRALELGYDPEFVSRMLQAGPAEAGPILDQLTTDVDAAFVEMVNDAEGAISELSELAIRAAQITQQAINATGEDAAWMAENVGEATAIAQTMMTTHGSASIEELARIAGVTEAEVLTIAERFGIELDSVLRDRTIRVGIEAAMNGGPITIDALVANASVANRWGDVHEYAGGGFGVGIYHGTNGRPIHKFAEPETGGEFYMPRLGDKAKNEAMFRQVGRDWLGLDVVPAGGGERRPRRSNRGRFAGTRVRDVTFVTTAVSPQQVTDALMWEQA